MSPINLKQKIMILIALIGAILIWIFQHGLYSKSPAVNPTKSLPAQIQTPTAPDKAEVVITKPDPLEGATILPTQTIEITFNLPLENVGEFKHRLDPKLDYTIKLSADRKTALITPTKMFQLGTTYTLVVQSDQTKFDGKKRLDHDFTYHFRTIEYRGV